MVLKPTTQAFLIDDDQSHEQPNLWNESDQTTTSNMVDQIDHTKNILEYLHSIN